MQTEIEQLNKRISDETPPTGVLYYKYKPDANMDEEETKQTAANRQTLDTSDKNKIKIRFTDLPISKATVSGL